MKEQLNKNIKEIIDKYPKVQKILDEYSIGCSTCGVGTCKLRDVIEIHNLSLKDEEELLKKIAGVIFPGSNAEIPQLNRKVSDNKLKYSPPMKRLVDEHKLIKRLLERIPLIAGRLTLPADNGLIMGIVDFIRSYADKYHHAKEEDILFKFFSPELDILKVMHEDHEKGRGHVKAIVNAVEGNDIDGVIKNLLAYKELLTEHIKKEDEILYPWMDRNLSDKEIGVLFSRFIETDKKAGGISDKYHKFIDKIEKKFRDDENGR